MPATNVDDSGPANPVVAPAAPPKYQYAIKTALALTLAYLLPMALGWSQPQTAATTVMIIAAGGLLSESLQKGVARVLGTIVGAVIGLCLIALFPQDRMTYLLVVSVTVAIVIFLYNAYQGDSTVFMLTSVVTLMVFNGGDAEGAFLYGMDRAFMTVFGVIIYSLVASCLWPVKAADNTRTLAREVAQSYSQAFERLVRPEAHFDTTLEDQIGSLLAQSEAFQTHFASVKGTADGVADYQQEWNTILGCYEELQIVLVPGLHQAYEEEYSHHTGNYHELVENISELFKRIDNAWQLREPATTPLPTLEAQYNQQSLEKASHLTTSAVFARAEQLTKIQHALLDLEQALLSLLFDRSGFHATRQPRGKPAFIWLDVQNLKTAARAFVAFWIAAAIWMEFNPPGGFMFVTMCTIFIPLVSYTPVTPKLLVILFSLGFFFALPAYIFLLPQLTHWLQLAAFIFSYAFIGFFVFQGPVSIFFLLGLFTLGIQNSMSYHLDAIALIMLMFYMVCATLIIILYVPFTSRPEKIYADLQRRFFHSCARSIELAGSSATSPLKHTLHRGVGAALLAKMKFWGAQVDPAYFHDNGPAELASLNQAAELLLGELQVLELRNGEFAKNPLITAVRRKRNASPMADLCRALAQGETDQASGQLREQLGGLKSRLDELLGPDYLGRYDHAQLAQFYVYLNLQASVLDCLENCRRASKAIDWQALATTRF